MSEKILKDKIIELALKLFLEKGYNSVTMDEMSKELTISKKSFYKIFPSKKTIAQIAIKYVLRNIEQKLVSIIESNDNSLVKLNKIISNSGYYLKQINKERMKDFKNYIPDLWEEIQKFRKEVVIKKIDLILQQAKEEGYLKQDVNLDILFMIFEFSVLEIINPKIIADKPYSTQEAMQSIISIIFTGAMTQEAIEKFNLTNQ